MARLINVGSVASDLAFPFQGLYATSKHAVKGFTDTLRMELIAEGAPVSVTLVKPTSIDTPLPQRARNYMDREPTLPPPIYPPEEVANAILHAAVHPQRDIFVGGGGKLFVDGQGIRARRLRRVGAGHHRSSEARGAPRGARGRPARARERRAGAGRPADLRHAHERLHAGHAFTRSRRRRLRLGLAATAALVLGSQRAKRQL